MIVEFFDDHGQHEYQIDSRDVPSATQVLGSEGLTSFEFCKEEHRLRGTAVHRIAQILATSPRGDTVEEIIQNSRWDPSATAPELVGYGRGAALYLLERFGLVAWRVLL